MGFRIRKSIKIAPGIKVNLSKSGISTSLGGRGASVNVGHGRIKGTVGIPGTGLSYTAQTKKQKSATGREPEALEVTADQTGSVAALDKPSLAPRAVVSSPIYRYQTSEGLNVVVDARGLSTHVDVVTGEANHRLKYLAVVKHGDGLIIATSGGRGVRVSPEQAREVKALVARNKGRQLAAKVAMALCGFAVAFVILVSIAIAASGI